MEKLNWHKYTNLEQFPSTHKPINLVRCCFYAAGVLMLLAMGIVFALIGLSL